MKILMYCANYAPELTGIGKYNGEQAEWLAARGHDVRVISAPPWYPAWRVSRGYSSTRYARETLNDVTVFRVPLWVPHRPGGLKRIVHLMSFALSSLPCLAAQWRWRPDVVFVIEPTLMCCPATLLFGALRGSRTWLHVQDFEVDAAFALGVLRWAPLHRFAGWVERQLMRRFDRVSTISHAMVELAKRKGVDPGRLSLLPNWAALTDRPVADASFRRALGIPEDAVVALYSGNMGNKQGLEILSEAAWLLRDQPAVHFILCGDGPGRAPLESSCAGLERIHFLPLQPMDRFRQLLATADIHLLPQRAGAADLVMPSKLTGMLASRRAVIATAEPHTELGQLITRVGELVPPENAAALAQTIMSLAHNPDRRAALAEAGRQWAEANLDRDTVLGRLEAEFKALKRQPKVPAGAPLEPGAE